MKAHNIILFIIAAGLFASCKKESFNPADANNINDLPEGLVNEIVNFFASYNNLSEDMFNPLGNEGPEVAIRLIKDSIKKASDT